MSLPVYEPIESLLNEYMNEYKPSHNPWNYFQNFMVAVDPLRADTPHLIHTMLLAIVQADLTPVIFALNPIGTGVILS